MPCCWCTAMPANKHARGRIIERVKYHNIAPQLLHSFLVPHRTPISITECSNYHLPGLLAQLQWPWGECLHCRGHLHPHHAVKLVSSVRRPLFSQSGETSRVRLADPECPAAAISSHTPATPSPNPLSLPHTCKSQPWPHASHSSCSSGGGSRGSCRYDDGHLLRPALVPPLHAWLLLILLLLRVW